MTSKIQRQILQKILKRLIRTHGTRFFLSEKVRFDSVFDKPDEVLVGNQYRAFVREQYRVCGIFFWLKLPVIKYQAMKRLERPGWNCTLFNKDYWPSKASSTRSASTVSVDSANLNNDRGSFSNGSFSYWESCDRCNGSGYTQYRHIQGGVCFRCKGSGRVSC